MRLYEFQAKELLKRYDIAVPESRLISSVEEIMKVIGDIGLPLVIKAQVLAGGRGKAGLVVTASDKQTALTEAERILKQSLHGEKVRELLIEKMYPHNSELYLSIALDRGERSFVAILSKEGGVDVESLTNKIVERIPLSGIDRDFAKSMVSKLNIDPMLSLQLEHILLSLEKLSRENECELAEINPLAVGIDGKLCALDAKIILDDNSLFRHPEFSMQISRDEFESEASRYGFAFVRLDGNIGVVGNGAGLVLSTLDLVVDEGGKPACFLDLGGGAQRDRVTAALRLVNKLANVDRILINIFGGITRTTDVAEGLLSILPEIKDKPIYARISGAEEEEAIKILRGTGVKIYHSAEDAVRAVVRME